MRDEDIDTSDAPEITMDIADKGIVRVNGKPVAHGKTRLTMYLDTALVEYFKPKAGARGYQTLINEALKQAIMHESLETTLRRVLRDFRHSQYSRGPRNAQARVTFDDAMCRGQRLPRLIAPP